MTCPYCNHPGDSAGHFCTPSNPYSNNPSFDAKMLKKMKRIIKLLQPKKKKRS